MWSKLVFCAVLLCLCMGAAAVEKPECGSAVDAADRLAPDSDKDCDYTKTGLNGVLHKAFSGKKALNKDNADSVVETHQEELPKAALKLSKVAPNRLIVTASFNSQQQWQTVKFSLLESAAQQCPAGFVVVSEQYLPAVVASADAKAMTLGLTYQCL